MATTRFLVHRTNGLWRDSHLPSLSNIIPLLGKLYITSKCYSNDNSTRNGVARSTQPHSQPSCDVIRNIGIIAHVDAGKTTTTERMLYLSGFTRHLGDVDDGTTVMDYMKQERERGITINSASITFDWNNFRFNLIDTPGHIDFTFEVERSLKVLDGGITLFDASAGVEAQTVSVWRQANRYNIPRLGFINKMDKKSANYKKAVQSIKDKLNTVPILTQFPLGQGKDFNGLIDLVTMDVLLWQQGDRHGNQLVRSPLKCHENNLSEFIKNNDSLFSHSLLTDVYDARGDMIEQLAMLDDILLEKITNDGSYNPLKVDKDVLCGVIKRVTCTCTGVPLLLGSSLKNIGVDLLLDAVCLYLPSPEERHFNIPDSLKKLFAVVFKVTHDRQRGPLVHMRIYSGNVKTNSNIYNITQDKVERVSRVLLVLADEHKELPSMSHGNIAVLAGLKHTVTGDIICHSRSCNEQLSKEQHTNINDDDNSFVLLQSPLTIPQPMFFCSIEPETGALQKKLDHALSCLSHEDPSLRVSYNNETGQTILSGMGELHLSIIHDRIQREYGISTALGELQVAYRETPSVSVTQSNEIKRIISNTTHQVSVELTLEPVESTGAPVSVDIIAPLTGSTSTMKDVKRAIINGVELACLNGPVLSYPVVQVKVTINSLQISPGTSLAVITSCINTCVSKALKESHGQLLEPLMNVTLTVPDSYLRVVLSDLATSRRGQVLSIDEEEEEGEKIVTCLVPVSSLSGYAAALRSKTSGTSSFSAVYSHYALVPQTTDSLVGQSVMAFSSPLVLGIKRSLSSSESVQYWSVPQDVNFRMVLDVISQLLLGNDPLPTSFEYEDEDGDCITVCNDEELGALLSYCQWYTQQYGVMALPVCIYPKVNKKRNTLNLEVNTKVSSVSSDLGSSDSGSHRKPDEQSLINLLSGGQITPHDLHYLEILGHGSGGTVYRTFHTPTKVIMAVKVLPLDATLDEQSQIMMELDILHKCDSKYIIGFYGAFFQENRISICTEYMDGGSLDHYGPIPELVLGKITVAIVKGLNYLWNMKIMHRDIKPSNTLVNTQGQVKLCDFGVSTQLLSSITKTFIGTNAYMAPERILGGEYGIHSEVWSLGVTLLEMALGRFPYLPEGAALNTTLMPFDLLQFIVNEKPPSLPPGKFSPPFLDFIGQCMIKIPNSRPGVDVLLRHSFLQLNEDNCEETISSWVTRALEHIRIMKRVPSDASLASSSSSFSASGSRSGQDSANRTTRHYDYQHSPVTESMDL